MRDYIQTPEILASLDELHDGRLRTFLQNCEVIEKKRFSLDNLRALYVKDRTEFIKVVDELTLRGFSFYTEKPNNILPSGQPSYARYIYAKDNENKFERLDYQSLGLSGFLQRFQVDDDRFFQYVPIDGFKNINRHLDVQLLESELLKAGFSLYDQEADHIIEPTDKLTKATEPPVGDANNHTKMTPPIQKVFYENRFNTFVNYCKHKGISTIGEITDRHFDEYASMRGVGVGKVQAVKDLVELELEKSYAGEGSEQDLNQAPVEIDVLFSENAYRVFRRYCKDNHIHTVFDFTFEHLRKFADSKGVGVAKVDAVANKINEILLQHNKLPLAPDDSDNDLSISPVAGGLEVASIFTDSRFYLFREYCRLNGIVTLGQLKNEHLLDYSKQKMVGRKKLEEVMKVLQSYGDSKDAAPQIFTSGEIYEFIHEVEVQQLLHVYGFHTQSHSKLKVKDIEGQNLEDLKDKFEPYLLMNLSRYLVNQKSPAQIAIGLKELLREREYEIIFHRYGHEQTLEEIGALIGVTRERVRQIAKKAVNKIVGYIRREHLSHIIKVLAPNGVFITGQELIEILGDEYEFLVKIIKQEAVAFKYYEKVDLFFLQDKEMDLNPLEGFLEELPELFKMEDYREPFEEMLESLGLENGHEYFIQKIIEGERYIKYGEFYSRYRMPINDVLSCLFKYYIQGSLKLDEEGAEYLQKLAVQKLDYDIGNTLRSIDARMRDAENVLLVDRATFAYFDSENFDQSIIIEIEEYLVEGFKSKDVINVEMVFEHLRSKLETVGVQNKYHLYSLIRYYLDEKFTIGKGNTLNIFNNESSKVSIEERIVNFMRKHGGICTKEQLLEVAKPQYKIDLAISHSDLIIPWGSNKAMLVENLKMTAKEKEQLTHYFTQSFQKGYTTVSFLYKEMMFDRKHSVLLREKGIDDPSKLTAIIKLLYPAVKGHTNFLYIEGSEFDSFEKVIEHHFDGETSRQEIKDFTMEFGYKHMMASVFLRRLFEEGTYVEIDLDVLYPGKKLEIGEEELAEIKAYAEEQQGDKEYLSLSNLQGYRRKLPYIGFRWTANLLNSVLMRCGYRQIIKVLNDYRYDKIIVVKEDSTIQTFEDLIIHILTNEYKGNMHEFAVYDFLAEKGIVREQEYMHEKTLPYEIRTSANFFIDELGNVSLRQGK